jgi:hypothetical protein
MSGQFHTVMKQPQNIYGMPFRLFEYNKMATFSSLPGHV